MRLFTIYHLLSLRRRCYKVLGDVADKLSLHKLNMYYLTKWMNLTGKISDLILLNS